MNESTEVNSISNGFGGGPLFVREEAERNVPASLSKVIRNVVWKWRKIEALNADPLRCDLIFKTSVRYGQATSLQEICS